LAAGAGPAPGRYFPSAQRCPPLRIFIEAANELAVRGVK
jgi:hypothetical protein